MREWKEQSSVRGWAQTDPIKEDHSNLGSRSSQSTIATNLTYIQIMYILSHFLGVVLLSDCFCTSHVCINSGTEAIFYAPLHCLEKSD